MRLNDATNYGGTGGGGAGAGGAACRGMPLGFMTEAIIRMIDPMNPM